MMVREPIVAGQFYPAAPDRCREELLSCVAAARLPRDLPRKVLGGIVPHAGWACSGAVAAHVFEALAERNQPETIVMFGAAHRWTGKQAAVFPSGRWDTPLGPVEVDQRLAERLLGHTNAVTADPFAHEEEHSLEVQIPFVKHFFPDARILPIMVPPHPAASGLGEVIGRTLETYRVSWAVLGTTDLTHYGQAYHFEPKGTGEAGFRWAKEINDQRMISLLQKMAASEVIPEAQHHRNACGAGAVAATLALLAQQGADRSMVLQHTSSHEVLRELGGDASVGYVGIIYGRD